MKRIFVGNLAPDANDNEIQELFTQYGTVRDIRLVRDVFSNQCRGFGTIDMEGHEARAAIAGLDGTLFKGRPIKVKEEVPKAKRGKHGGRR
jgi:RNA recognition motif-containing protein